MQSIVCCFLCVAYMRFEFVFDYLCELSMVSVFEQYFCVLWCSVCEVCVCKYSVYLCLYVFVFVMPVFVYVCYSCIVYTCVVFVWCVCCLYGVCGLYGICMLRWYL